ncbi:MAG: YaeQ family protein, partial [Gammaproteobacteria bacterium]|nr:YaeQ family protein [Gammaproteobacteria bacterium]
VRKACGLAEKVSVYSFNRKAPVWWQQSLEKFSGLNASIYRFKWEQVDALKLFVARNMHFSITLSEETIYLVSGDQSLELDVIALQ